MFVEQFITAFKSKMKQKTKEGLSEQVKTINARLFD